MIADYISNMNKTVTGLQPEEKRPARNELLNRIRNWNTAYDENDKALIASYDSDSSDGYLITSLPAAKLEYTLNKTKYIYTMTPSEYSEFIDEYLSEVEKQRKKALRSYSKSSEVLSEKLKNAKSEAAANIRERYKSKLRKKFEKIS